MKFAYADPPYINQSKKHYKNHKDYAGEVNHKELINQLVKEYPDGWALSLSAVSLKEILNLCPDDVRVMIWVKPFHAWKKGVTPSYGYEPVIVYGGRKRTEFGNKQVKALGFTDWVSANITLKKGLTGAKPQKFCLWLFEVLNVQPGDTLDDLYPGTEIVSNMFNWYIDQYKDDATDLKEISKNNAVEYLNDN
jgi:hypothetical protein